jgi:hypothetical protein
MRHVLAIPSFDAFRTGTHDIYDFSEDLTDDNANSKLIEDATGHCANS